MIRFTMVFLCLILAGAAAGRYHAEVRVKEKREEIKALEQEKARELAEIQLLRAEIAYLESPERLTKIAEKITDLAPLTGAQLLTADDFAVAFGREEAPAAKPESDFDTILHAIALADSTAAPTQQ